MLSFINLILFSKPIVTCHTLVHGLNVDILIVVPFQDHKGAVFPKKATEPGLENRLAKGLLFSDLCLRSVSPEEGDEMR